MREEAKKQKKQIHVACTVGWLVMLTLLEMQETLGPLASLGGNNQMEDHTLHMNKHVATGHLPLPPWGSLISPRRSGREG